MNKHKSTEIRETIVLQHSFVRNPYFSMLYRCNNYFVQRQSIGIFSQSYAVTPLYLLLHLDPSSF